MQPIERKRIVVKIGGSMLAGLQEEFFLTLKQLQFENHELILVHGGGPAINEQLEKRKLSSTEINGIRVTSKEVASIIQSTLIGTVNPSLVHEINRNGIEAIGLSGYDGNLLTCSLLDEKVYGYVGKITHVRAELIEKLLKASVVPVISCIGTTTNGSPLNINADTVASEIALAMNADSLLFVTDTPGIRIEDNVQRSVTIAEIEQWIQSGAIYGGMLPKVAAAVSSLNAGVSSIQIVGQQLKGTVIEQKGVVV